jgi:ketosteroid isomerase-like protein
MTFRETLTKHLQAIQQRDLDSLIETLPPDELVLIMSDGRLVRTVREFVEAHRGWFSQTTWTLAADLVKVTETPDLGVAVIHLDYRDQAADGRQIHETSYLTLIFARQGGKWVMVHDQNTPIRSPTPSPP